MSSRLPRKLLLLGLFVLPIIGAGFVFQHVQTYLESRQEAAYIYTQQARATKEESSLDRDQPWDPEPTQRVVFKRLGQNKVMCWPSVGGIIIGDHLSSVELDFLNISRFESVQRSYNITEEDAFCMQLRKTGGKWWQNHNDYLAATLYRSRGTTAAEKEALILGWPEKWGVWVRRETSMNRFGMEPGFWRLGNAHTMEERCKILEADGATFYETPGQCQFVKPLLVGFGEHTYTYMDLVYGNLADEYWAHQTNAGT